MKIITLTEEEEDVYLVGHLIFYNWFIIVVEWIYLALFFLLLVLYINPVFVSISDDRLCFLLYWLQRVKSFKVVWKNQLHILTKY